MDSTSRILRQNATTDQANSHKRGAEAKNPTEKKYQASDTEWLNRPRTSKGKKPVSCQKKQAKPKWQQQHPYTRDDERKKCQQSFEFVQIVSQTENSKKFKLAEMSGDLFHSTDSISHSILTDFKIAASNANQVKEEFPNTYLEFGSKASKGKVYAQKISPNGFNYHFIVKPGFWNKPTYSSLRAAMEPMFHRWNPATKN